MRSWIRYVSVVMVQAWCLGVIGAACVMRPRDERVVVVEPAGPPGAQDAAQSIVQALQLHPAAQSGGYSTEEICRLIRRYPDFAKKFVGSSELEPEDVAHVLDGLDRDGDTLLSPEELARGLLDKLPLIAAMKGAGMLLPVDLEAFVATEFPGAATVQQRRLVARVLRYDTPALGGDGDGKLSISEARFPSLAIHMSRRLSPASLKSGFGLLQRLKPSERRFLAQALEYKIKQEGMNVGEISGWGNEGVFIDQEPKGDSGRALAVLLMLRLDHVFRLTAQGLEPSEMLSYFYVPVAPVETSTWSTVLGLYRLKSTADTFSTAFENFLLLTDLETADRLFRGEYAGGYLQDLAYMFLYPRAVMKSPTLKTLEQTLEHLNGRFLTHSFFKSYDANDNMKLDRQEFERGIRAWNGDVAQMTYVFFNRNEQEIDPGTFLQRGWTTLRPYLWDL